MPTTENGYGLNRNDSPYTEAECDEIITKLEQLLDGEMDDQNQEEVLEMINNCQYCLEQYNIEKSIRGLVKNGIKNFRVSGNLLNTIRNRIKSFREETPEAVQSDQ